MYNLPKVTFISRAFTKQENRVMRMIRTTAAGILSVVMLSSWTPAQWDVRDWRGTPTLWKDNQPVTPMMFWQWKPEQYEIEKFSNAGMGLFSFFGSFQHYEHPYWKADGSVTTEFQDCEIRKLLSYNPKAYFLPRVFTTAPEWWVKANPGELCAFSKGELKSPRESMASQKYLNETGRAYRQAVRHMIDADYGKQMMGVHVTSGPWGESFYWDALCPQKNRPAGSDVSEPMRLALIDYLKTKYGNDVSRLQKNWNDKTLTFNTVQVPTVEQRIQTTAGAWRDPARSRAVMDYFECHNQVVVRLIDHFCKIVKEESKGNLLTMVFYGYTQDENWPIESDHRGISKLLRLDSVDMLSAPHTYYRRALGEDAEMRQYFSSTALHGKLFFDEGDDQTHLEKRKANPDHRCHVNTVEESQALLYREFGNSATHGTGLWYMDLKGGWFKDETLIDTIGRMKKWADTSLKHSRKRNAQVALISAPESEFYLGYRESPDNEISYGLYHDQMAEFYRTGAPFDWYLIDDLEAIAEQDYKIYIFMDCFYLTEQQRKQIETLRSKNRTLLWFYAPGYASQENLSQERMEKLTGFRFEQTEQGILKGTLIDSGREIGIDKTQKTLFTVLPEKGVRKLAAGTGTLKDKLVLAQKKNHDWTSIFSTIPGVPSDLLRKMYADAGVHVYSDCGDVITANESWLMIHTRTAGSKQIRLPGRYKKVTEITGEKVIGENIDTFTIDLPQYVTAIFLLE